MESYTFLAYQFTDDSYFEDPQGHVERLRGIVNPLRAALHDRNVPTFCSLDMEEYLNEHIVDGALEWDDKARIINGYVATFIPGAYEMIIFMRNPRVSKGINQELELAAQHSIDVSLIIREGLDHTNIRDAAQSRVLEYKTFDQLYEQVRTHGLPWRS